MDMIQTFSSEYIENPLPTQLIVRNKELQAHNEVSESEEGDRSRELEEPPASADTVWPVLINGRTVWVELDNKPSPKVRPTGLQNYSSIL